MYLATVWDPRLSIAVVKMCDLDVLSQGAHDQKRAESDRDCVHQRPAAHFGNRRTFWVGSGSPLAAVFRGAEQMVYTVDLRHEWMTLAVIQS